MIEGNSNVKDKNPKNKDGRTPLHVAAAFGQTQIYDFIIKHVKDKNPSANNGDTPLHIAAREGHVDVCKLIIANVVDRAPLNSNGESPLWAATTSSCKKLLSECPGSQP